MGRKIRIVLVFSLLTVNFLLIASGFAAYPEKPISFIIPFGVGGDTDLSARVLAKGVEKELNTPLLVNNKPGAGGALAYAEARSSSPDGYTLLWVTSSIFTTTAIGNIDFDYTAFEPVARAALVQMPIVVRGDSPWKTWQDFVNDAKKSPRKLKFGHAGTGSVGHMLAVAMTSSAGIETIMAPVGVDRRVPGILSGEIDITNGPVGEFVEQVKGGKMRLLVAPSEKKLSNFPNVPTAKEVGLNVVFDMMFAVFAPKGIPKDASLKIREAFKKSATGYKPWLDYASSKGHLVTYLDGPPLEIWLKKESEFVDELMKKAGLYLSQKKK